MRKIYYGWIVLGVTVFSGFILGGIGFTFGLFVLPMQRDLGWSVAAIAAAMGVRQITSGIFQPVSGALVRRFGPKKIIILGLSILGISTTMMFTVNSVWHFYLQLGVASTLGVTMGAAGPMSAMISRWFRKRRTMTLAISRTGSSAGQLVLTGVVYLLLSSFGWRMSYTVLGLLVVGLVVPMSIFLLKDDPAEMGLLPDGERPAPGSPPLPKVKGAWQKAKAPASGELNRGLRDALRTRNFWLLCTGYFGCGVSATFIFVYLVPYAVQEVGLTEASAAIAYAAMGGANIFGIMAAGYFGDRIGKKIPLGIVYLGRGIAAMLMLYAATEWQVYVAAILMGLCSFASGPLVQAIVVDNWGSFSMALISGVVLMVHQVGGTAGSAFGGWILEAYGSVDPGWAAMAATMLVGGIAAFMILEKRTPRVVPATAQKPATG